MRRTVKFFARVIEICGVVLLIYCAFIWGRGQLFQARQKEFIESLARQRQAAVTSPSASDLPTHIPLATGAPIAEISIPRLNLSTVVVEGTGDAELKLGAGHVSGTALPGVAGNIVIAAHRDTFFRPLRNINVGDKIVLNTGREAAEYVVEATRVTTPDDIAVMQAHGEPELTLITCYPFNFIGSAPDRFIVHAKPVAVPISADNVDIANAQRDSE
jgi:sortase A